MNCSKHHDQEITWVCLEKQCDQRVMCSRCAVKVHPRDHKLEELSSVVQTGIMNAYQNNPINNTYGIESTVGALAPINVEEIIAMVESNLRKVCEAIKLLRLQLVNQTVEIYRQEEHQRQNVHEHLKIFESKLAMGQFTDAKELAVIIDEAFNTINSYAEQKEQELQNQHNSDLTIFQKKLTILSSMQSNFQTMISQYLDNQFTKDFCSLFEMQLQTLSFDRNHEKMDSESDLQSLYQEQQGGNVSDSNGFLDFIQRKWQQDYENIDYTLQKFTTRLGEGLKYVINLPVHNEQASYQSPNKRQVHYTQFPTPIYAPPYPAMMIPQPHFIQHPQQQQYMISPKPMRDENLIQMQHDHMAQSQIVYMIEETQHVAFQPNRKVEVQPVCQRALQQKDNEMKSGGSRIVQSKVDTKQPKVAQTLSTFINKISNVTNKSINK